MRLRQHRGTLVESLATTVEIEPTIEALAKAMRDALAPHIPVEARSIEVAPYGFDTRCGWNTHIVTMLDHGVFGFTDGPLLV